MTQIPKPQFIRLIIQVEARNENTSVVNEIADFAESRMPKVVGFKLIKTAHETVHAIENYGSKAPPLPQAKRSNSTAKECEAGK